VQVHPTLHNVVITCHQSVQDHGAVGIGCLGGRLIVVSANEVGMTRGPREPIGRIKIAQVGEHRIVLATRIVANEQFKHLPVLLVATERLIDSTDFRRGTNEVTVVEMVIVQLLVRGERLLHAQKRAPVGVVHEIVFAIQVAIAFSAHPISELTLEPIAQGCGFVGHTQLIGNGQNF